MICPYCGEDNDKVIDSRATEGGRSIRRRRECLACEKRFTTYEHVEQTNKLYVIKSDRTRVPYDRDRALSGLQKACYKRPISAEQQIAIVEDLEEELFRQNLREIESLEIGKALAERLKKVDHVAYVRFASVYKQFRDVEDFVSEVRELLQSTDGPDLPEQGKLF